MLCEHVGGNVHLSMIVVMAVHNRGGSEVTFCEGYRIGVEGGVYLLVMLIRGNNICCRLSDASMKGASLVEGGSQSHDLYRIHHWSVQ